MSTIITSWHQAWLSCNNRYHLGTGDIRARLWGVNISLPWNRPPQSGGEGVRKARLWVNGCPWGAPTTKLGWFVEVFETDKQTIEWVAQLWTSFQISEWFADICCIKVQLKMLREILYRMAGCDGRQIFSISIFSDHQCVISSNREIINFLNCSLHGLS